MPWVEITTTQTPNWVAITTINPLDENIVTRQNLLVLTRSDETISIRPLEQNPNWVPVDDSQA